MMLQNTAIFADNFCTKPQKTVFRHSMEGLFCHISQFLCFIFSSLPPFELFSLPPPQNLMKILCRFLTANRPPGFQCLTLWWAGKPNSGAEKGTRHGAALRPAEVPAGNTWQAGEDVFLVADLRGSPALPLAAWTRVFVVPHTEHGALATNLSPMPKQKTTNPRKRKTTT